ncbi:MAG: hypothetical protein MUC94_18130 [bacterium]|nr:hypothetical protein [bacterium]
MKTKSITRILSIVTVIILLAGSLYAQHRPRRMRQPAMMKPAASVGLRIGNDFKHDQYLVGAHFWLPVGLFWNFIPSADYYFTDNDFKRWQFNGDVVFKPRPRGSLYFGGGVAVEYLTLDDRTDVGGNVLVGLEFRGRRKTPITPYIQARWTFLDENREYFSLLGGINFILR